MRAARALRPSIGPFGVWQPLYEAQGIVTLPVDPVRKKWAVEGPSQFGMKASREMVRRRGDSLGIGFNANAARITVADIDTTDERQLADWLSTYGESRFIVRTASGKWHAYYATRGEGRLVRPLGRETPVDVLGAGLVVAAGSVSPEGTYEIVHGDLDDLRSLTAMNGAAEVFRKLTPANDDRRLLREGDGRNNDLFAYARVQALHCDDRDQLLDVARQYAAENFHDAMSDAEIGRTVASVWRYKEKGQLFTKGEKRVVLNIGVMDRILAEGGKNASAGMALYAAIKKQLGAHELFTLPHEGWREPWACGLSRADYRSAKRLLERAGAIRSVRRWSSKAERAEEFVWSDAA